MPYKLVQIDNGRIVTGEELYDILSDAGFQVPAKQPLVLLPYPVPPVKPPITASHDEMLAYVTANNAAKYEWQQVHATNLILEQAYYAQFSNFADTLEETFVLATLVYTGEKDSNGRKIKEYRVVQPCLYSFAQCADKLMGKSVTAPADPVRFICFEKF